MDLIDKVVAAYKEAAAVNTPHPDTPVRSEAQNAAILAAQVKEIMNHYSSEDVLLSRIVALESKVQALSPPAPVPAPAPEAPIPAAAAPDEPQDETEGDEGDGDEGDLPEDADLIPPHESPPAEHEDEHD